MNLSLAMPTQGGDTECLPPRLFGETVLIEDRLDRLLQALLEPFPIRSNRIGALVYCFYAFSSREPASASLENALTGSRMVSIDAIAPLEVVTRTIKRALWGIL